MLDSERWRISIRPLHDGVPAFPGFESILDLWNRKRGGRLLPSRRDFELWDLGHWAGHVNFSIRTDRGPRFSLYGSENARLFGKDLTGQFLCDHIVDDYRSEIVSFFEELSRQIAVGHISGQSVMLDRQWLSVETLVLPLGDDHLIANRFMHVINAAIGPWMGTPRGWLADPH
ncbi:PAS domain-containing protein [Thalassobaculum sp.]|uniref:PAS domain-containing protein n=1 Tax=Thalassobaculum sp. TaxID=2022740 RepID=UPI0032EE6905